MNKMQLDAKLKWTESYDKKRATATPIDGYRIIIEDIGRPLYTVELIDIEGRGMLINNAFCAMDLTEAEHNCLDALMDKASDMITIAETVTVICKDISSK